MARFEIRLICDRPMQPTPQTKAFHPLMARIVAYLAGDGMDYIKLLKLAYLADRESLNRHNTPLTFDDYQALPRGPVPDDIYHVLEGKQHHLPGWRGVIDVVGSKPDLFVRSLIKKEEAASYLSEATVKILDQILKLHKNKSPEQLVEYTHKYCPEWDKVKRRDHRRKIHYQDVLLALHKKPDVAKEIAAEILAHRAERASLA